MSSSTLRKYAFLLAALEFVPLVFSQFRDDFGRDNIAIDSTAHDGWAFLTGDGQATMDLRADGDHAIILVDATHDRRNIWWALIRRCISGGLDLSPLQKPEFELRVEARVRVSTAPRRVNLHFNTQRTTDFHSHLMEFDIPAANEWYTISMTTHDFDARPGDQVFAQMALMDWGREKYRVDVDYLRADIVDVAAAGPDLGVAVPYHPPVLSLDSFAHVIRVAHDAMIDAENPDTNFDHWTAREDGTGTRVLTVNGAQQIILRWNLSALAGQKIEGSGVLELTTHSVQRLSERIRDFGLIRVVEILGGDPHWEQTTVTYGSFCGSTPLDQVVNPQMIIDLEVNETRGGQTLATISNPVLQRLVDGQTRGLAILPLGGVQASFFSREAGSDEKAPKLHISLRD